MFSISGIVHLRSKALDRTILKIFKVESQHLWLGKYDVLKTLYERLAFCTLMLWLVLLKIRLARMAFANLLA